MIEGLQRPAAKKVLKITEFTNVLREARERNILPHRKGIQETIRELVERGELIEIELNFGQRKEKRYVKSSTDPYELALLLRPESYLSHETAIYFNQLCQEEPETIFVNSEQPKRPPNNPDFDQLGIDMAFRSQQRISKSFVRYKDRNIVLINGKNTGRLGVKQFTTPGGVILHYTGPERTLIDITVRPAYAGGVQAVLKVFEQARKRLSIKTLISFLKQLDYTYPYHQAIAFYIERAHYNEEEVNQFRSFEMKYDFYLSHGMKKLNYDKTWRLYYPVDFD